MKKILFFLISIIFITIKPFRGFAERPEIQMGMKQYPNLVFLPPSYLNQSNEPIFKVIKTPIIDNETNAIIDYSPKVEGIPLINTTMTYSIGGNDLLSSNWSFALMWEGEFVSISKYALIGINMSSNFANMKLYNNKIDYNFFNLSLEPECIINLIKVRMYSLRFAFAVPLILSYSSYDLNYSPYEDFDDFDSFDLLYGYSYCIHNTFKFGAFMFTIIPGINIIKLKEREFLSQDSDIVDAPNYYFTLPGETIKTYFVGLKLRLYYGAVSGIYLNYAYNYRPESKVTGFPAITEHIFGFTFSFGAQRDTVEEVAPLPTQQENDDIIII